MKQYSLKFPLQQSYLPQDYIITSANKMAHQVIMSAMPWGVEPYPYHLLLIAPKFSGKTHLAHLWSQKNNTKFISKIDDQGSTIDNIELWPERDLLHIFNLHHENKKPLLMTACFKPNFKLPDLQSRINSLKNITLSMPDAEMIIVLLMRHFSTRSLKVSSEVLDYLASRIKRDFNYIKNFVDLLDFYSLDNGRNITIPLISKLLNNLDN